MAYPRWKLRMDGLLSRLRPEWSERLFIKTMGHLWLWQQGFEHQVIIGPYRPDFVSKRRRLIIEIEGTGKIPKDILEQQKWYEAQERREMFLYRAGFSILYVKVSQMKRDPEGMKAMVKKWAHNPVKFTEDWNR